MKLRFTRSIERNMETLGLTVSGDICSRSRVWRVGWNRTRAKRS